LIGGSIPERKGTKLFNTSLTFSPTGNLLAVHRKVHLFDIDVPGKIKFQESEVLTGGQSLTDFDTDYGKLGVAICYDVRFPEMAMIAARKGAVAMIYPGAFNLTYPLLFENIDAGLGRFIGSYLRGRGRWIIKFMLRCVHLPGRCQRDIMLGGTLQL
jgi:hypothetical protein